MQQRDLTNVLDLSAFGKSRAAFSNSSKISMNDINRCNSSEDKSDQKQKTVFIIRENKISKSDRYAEMIRVMAGGLIILTMIHFVNIAQRGMVIKNTVIARAASGFESFIEGKKQMSQAAFAKAEDSFSAASKDFKTAMDSIEFLQTNQSIFYTSRQAIAWAQNVLTAGQNMADAAQIFAKGIESLRQWPLLFLSKNKDFSADKDYKEIAGRERSRPFPAGDSLTQKLKNDLIFLHEAKEKIKIAQNNLQNPPVDNIVPVNIREFEKIRQTIKQLLAIFDDIEGDIPAILKLLGDRELHRYLILLQNDAEARPTGGFIGSLMLVDVYNGKIIKNAFHDVYEFDGQFHENIEAPEDIAKITKNWRLRDANYSPDFAISAEKAAWFLQKEKGPSVDTVIAVNQHILRDLLHLTGPIEVEGLEKPLTQDNYQLILSFIIESKMYGKSDPKKILKNFIPAFQKKLFAIQQWNDVLKVFAAALLEKNILLYSRDQNIQNFFDKRGLGGRMQRIKSGEDYLQIVHTSTGGNKSDAFIRQEIQHSTSIGQDGKITDELKLTRKHLLKERQLLEWGKILKSFNFKAPTETIQNVLGKGANRSSVRIYVPPGSILLEAEGIDKNNVTVKEDSQLKKTYFFFEMETPQGGEKAIRLKYALPDQMEFIAADSYKFYFQPQPAFNASHFEKIISLGPAVKMYDKYPENLKAVDEKTFTFSQKEQKNLYLSILVGK